VSLKVSLRGVYLQLRTLFAPLRPPLASTKSTYLRQASPHLPRASKRHPRGYGTGPFLTDIYSPTLFHFSKTSTFASRATAGSLFEAETSR